MLFPQELILKEIDVDPEEDQVKPWFENQILCFTLSLL